MNAIQVQGRHSLNGRIWIQGSKNAVLPMMAAALMAKGTTVIHHVPEIEDVFSMMGILESLGCRCSLEDHRAVIDAKTLSGTEIPEAYVGRMRSSVMVLGPLLARQKEAVTSFPGGCVLGKRPIDLHLTALRQMGAEIMEVCGMVYAKADRLTGSQIRFSFPSVGATENAVMAAVTAEGTTILKNCAREPEIAELCRFLRAMGGRIFGIGTDELVIEGVRELSPCEVTLDGDRICAGTYLAAAAAVGGDVAVCGISPQVLKEPIRVFREMGAEVLEDPKEKEIRLIMKKRPRGFKLRTGPYPEFPTDLQSVFLAVSCMAVGESRLTEDVFEARFAAARELCLFGARIRVNGRTAVSEGAKYALKPAIVRAPDLRAGAALVIAGLAAEGVSLIDGRSHIERGYEDICRDFRELGADMAKIEDLR